MLDRYIQPNQIYLYFKEITDDSTRVNLMFLKILTPCGERKGETALSLYWSNVLTIFA